jgi:hypothetical protein
MIQIRILAIVLAVIGATAPAVAEGAKERMACLTQSKLPLKAQGPHSLRVKYPNEGGSSDECQQDCKEEYEDCITGQTDIIFITVCVQRMAYCMRRCE